MEGLWGWWAKEGEVGFAVWRIMAGIYLPYEGCFLALALWGIIQQVQHHNTMPQYLLAMTVTSNNNVSMLEQNSCHSNSEFPCH